jgi:hypothetical protein
MTPKTPSEAAELFCPFTGAVPRGYCVSTQCIAWTEYHDEFAKQGGEVKGICMLIRKK